MRILLPLALLYFAFGPVAMADNGKCGDYRFRHIDTVCLIDRLSYVEVRIGSDETATILGRDNEYWADVVRVQVKRHIPYLSHEVAYYAMGITIRSHELDEPDVMEELSRKTYIRCYILAIESDRVAYMMHCELWNWFNFLKDKQYRLDAIELGMIGKNSVQIRIEEAVSRVVSDLASQLAKVQLQNEMFGE